LELVLFSQILNFLDSKLEVAKGTIKLLKSRAEKALPNGEEKGTSTLGEGNGKLVGDSSSSSNASSSRGGGGEASSYSSSSSSSSANKMEIETTVGSDEDVQIVKDILRFTSLLLNNTMNKEVYSLTEVSERGRAAFA